MSNGWSEEAELVREFACVLAVKLREAQHPLLYEHLLELQRAHDRVLAAFGPACGACAAAYYTGANWGEPHEPDVCELTEEQQRGPVFSTPA